MNKKQQKIIEELKEIKSRKDALKGAYFWVSNSHASGRRAAESPLSEDYPLIGASVSVHQSCQNTYVTWSHTWNEVLKIAERITGIKSVELRKLI